MKILSKLNQTGDTIIEVMMVLALLGLSLGIAYSTANKGLGQSLNAEQHSEALGVLDSQIEELRDSIASGYFGSTAGYFCMNSTNTPIPIAGGVYLTAQQDSSHGYNEYGSLGSGCVFQVGSAPTKYYVSVNAASPATTAGTNYTYSTPVPCGNASCNESSFTFVVRWDGNGGLGPQQESMTYRIGTTVVGTGGYQAAGSGGSPALPTSVSYNGNQFSGCYNPSNDGWFCNTNSSGTSSTCGAVSYNYGTGVAAYQSGNTGPYNFITNYTTSINSSSDGKYDLNLTYTNFPYNCNGLPPAPYSYSVNVYVNGGDNPSSGGLGTLITTANLQPPSANLTPATITIPINGLSSAPTSITLEWVDDAYGANWDANFDIQSLTLVDN